jgi:alginate O-acetyltransferase complex protein AlgI
MLFTTAAFAFLFLPIVLGGYYLLGARSRSLTELWLSVASLFFYGYWLP